MRSFFQKLIYQAASGACYSGYALSFLLATTSTVYAQISAGGKPWSLTSAFQTQYGNRPPQEIRLPAFDLAKALKEDASYPGTRVAAPIPVDLGLENAGEWLEFANGDRLWRLKVRSEGALGLLFLYDKLYIPPGATLFMYNEDGSQTLGAYTYESNTPNGTFMTGFIYGETALLEYYEPRATRGQGALHLFRIDHGYRQDILAGKTMLQNGFGASQPCNKNVNCPEGLNWQRQKRGICRIIVVVQEGSGFCTGSLINNTANDGKPYILSAFHCQEGFTPRYDFWRFDFNYEAPGCSNPGVEPSFQSVLGSTLRASRRQNDFLLLEARSAIPPSYNVFFNGWDRATGPPATPVTIHHPRGDIKKISLDNQNAIIFGQSFPWQNSQGQIIFTSPPNHMFQVKFDASTVEIGSSGAPLFNPAGRIVGQLHGGLFLGNCDLIDAFSYFDRFILSWEGGGAPENRLRDWLDPAGTNALTLDGIEQPADTTMTTLSGFVRDPNGRGLAGVTIRLVGGAQPLSALTDTVGAYIFRNLPMGISPGISFDKNTNHRNGISVLDILLISRHILGIEELDSPLKLLAADVDNSKNINIVDLIKIRKVILGIDDRFDVVPSWRFLPTNFTFSDPKRPWDDFLPTVLQLPNFNRPLINFNVTAFKTGDVDFNADPSQ